MKRRADHTALVYPIILGAGIISAIALAFAVPSVLRVRAETAAYACIHNLEAISGAKKHWAVAYRTDSNAVPTWNDLKVYLAEFWSPEGFQRPRCPCGGIYTIGRVADAPTCSYPKHSLALAGVVVQAVADGAHPADKPIAGATVEVLDETGHRTLGMTGPEGRATIPTWPNRPIAVIISKIGFLTSSNNIQTIRSSSVVRLERMQMGS